MNRLFLSGFANSKPVRHSYRYIGRAQQENRVSSGNNRKLTQLRLVSNSRRPNRVLFSVEFPATNFIREITNRAVETTSEMPEKKQFQRLPQNVTPSHYDLFLKPNLKNATFEGRETVQIVINSPTSTIVLNSLELKIKSCVLTLKGGKVLKPVVKVNQEDETITLNFDEELPKVEADLNFEFAGELNDKMKGFYRSNSASDDGEQRYVAVTQFEPTDARRCFPCWDEPALKAVFEVTLETPKDKVVLSNMPCINEEVVGDQKISKFSPTPVMSTYLVAVVVGDFDHIEDTSEDGVLVRVYTPPGVKEQGRFALYVATKVLPYYKDYFQIAYPLPKIDLVAIADFSAGAMENWGLATYRQAYLLVDPENSAASHKQTIAVVVGHELAHQWFGNLVTMEWWTHLWLNEGYASFVENLCVAHLFPEYNIWTQFVSDIFIRALELDCLKNSHPIEVPVGHPSEIDEIFDDISYNKGASVIRMLHRYIGDEDFRKGMNLYLTRHQYKNTFTEDLWDALEDASKKPVRAVMSTWTRQMGFPVIRVTASEQEGTNRVLTVTQERFVADNSELDNSALWWVPLTFSIKGRAEEVVHSEVLETRTAKITIPNVPEDAWVKLNPGTNGVYRVQYSQSLLDQLIPSIEDKSLPPLDRLGIVDDLFALVKAGQASSVQILKVLSAVRNEDNFTVWSIIANCVGKLGALLSNTDYSEEFKKFGRYLFKPIGQKVGWEPKPGEGHMDTLLRSLIIGRLGSYGDAETIEEAKKRFSAHVAGESVIPADLRAAVYKSVLSVGDEDTFNTMIKLYRGVNLQEEKDRIGRALGNFQDKNVLSKVLEFVMTDEVRSQDKVFFIISVEMTKIGRELVWDFLRANWAELFQRYEGGFLINRLVKSSCENFASEEMAVKVEEFFKDKDCSSASRSVQQAVESIRLNAAWLKRDKDQIKEFLTNFKYD